MMRAPQRLRYDKQAFERYFTPPQPARKKRGRPKKKRRNREAKPEPAVVDLSSSLSKRQRDELKSKLKGAIATATRKPAVRVNWDVGACAVLRERLAQSWLQKNDLFEAGDSFARFCTKNGISRTVLKRYLANKKSGQPAKKRGRKTLLSESVIRHICEGMVLFFFCLGLHSSL